MDATPHRPNLDNDSNSSESPRSEATRLPVTRRKSQIDEWLLVLRAEGFTPEVERIQGEYHLALPPGETKAAAAILQAWQIERAERAKRPLPPPTRSAKPIEVAIASALAITLLAFHFGAEWGGRHEALIELGSSDAERVLTGEYERLVTALTLHSDLPHVLGNTLFGAFFLTLLAPRLGIGIGLFAFVLTGALGNLANALYYAGTHNSIGASTGVFGLVGVLAGIAAWHRQQTEAPRRGAWVSLGAGLGILAMLGTGGPRVDVSAHVFGLVVGAVSGGLIAIALAGRQAPTLPAQIAAAAASAALIVGAWARVLGHPLL